MYKILIWESVRCPLQKGLSYREVSVKTGLTV